MERESDRGELMLRVSRAGPDSAVATLAGRFDAMEAGAVRRRLAEDDVATVPHLVFDLAEVTFLDSAGLAVLVRARQDRLRSGGSVVLVRPVSEDAMRILRLTRFDQIFTVRDAGGDGSV